MSARLSLRDVVVRRRGRTVLDVPNLDVRAGEVLAVIGPNGAGKSTLVQTLALLERPAAGEVLFDGASVRGRELSVRRRLAVVFQEPLLLAGTVRDNVALGPRLRGVGRQERRTRAARWLDLLGIAPLADRPAHALSGGEAQRASLARALALEPEVLLLDEPFSSLDAPTRARLVDDLARLLRDVRMTTVFVTHDRDEALHLADRVAVLVGGRPRQLGAMADVFARPADADVAAFVGVETVVPGQVTARGDGTVRVRVGRAEVIAASQAEPGDTVLVCIRPEDVALAPAPAVAECCRPDNSIVGRVTAVLPAGGQRRVELDCGFPLVALVSRRAVEASGIVPGVTLAAEFAPAAVHLIARPA